MRLRPALLVPLALSGLVMVAAVHQLGEVRQHDQAGPSSAGTAGSAQVVRQRASVVGHTDGDSLWLQAGDPGPVPHRAAVKVRLLGIDAPETTATTAGRPTCYGAEASRRTAELLPRGTVIEVETDVELRDRYHRYLVYLWRGGILINEVLARQGYARLTTGHPNVRYADRLRSAEQSARAARRGLWGACR